MFITGAASAWGRRKGLVPPHTDTPGPWTMRDDAIGPDAVVAAAKALGFETVTKPHGYTIAAHDGQARILGYGSAGEAVWTEMSSSGVPAAPARYAASCSASTRRS